MVIARTELLKLIKEKKVKITPFKKSQIGPGSIDLSLSNEFRTIEYKDNTMFPKPIRVSEKIDYKKHTEKFKSKKLVLHPGEFILGITKEKIKLPENICGWLQGRTRFARMGLTVHMTASFVHPGSEGKQVLEIFNMGGKPLELHAGDKIVQLVLEYTDGKGKLKGFARNQVL